MRTLRVLVAGVALGLATVAPAGAQEPGSLLRSIDGPTTMRPLASGFDVRVGYQRLWSSTDGHFYGDRDRWVAWNTPGRETGSTLLDTQTMALRDVPECRLSYGRGGLFTADCPDRTPRASLYDAATGGVSPVPGALEGDSVHWIGEHWLAGDDRRGCPDRGCRNNVILINRRTGERRVGCRRCSMDDPRRSYTLDKPQLERRRVRYDPTRVEGDLSILRGHTQPLVVRRRGRPPVRLARCLHRFGWDNCDSSLAAGRVSWASVNADPRAPAGTVNGYVPETGQRATWTFRFAPDARFGCRRAYGPAVRSFHTRHAVIAVAVDRFAESASGGRCQAYPLGFTLYAAPWP
jgi:hypothetical protein